MGFAIIGSWFMKPLLSKEDTMTSFSIIFLGLVDKHIDFIIKMYVFFFKPSTQNIRNSSKMASDLFLFTMLMTYRMSIKSGNIGKYK